MTRIVTFLVLQINLQLSTESSLLSATNGVVNLINSANMSRINSVGSSKKFKLEYKTY